MKSEMQSRKPGLSSQSAPLADRSPGSAVGGRQARALKRRNVIASIVVLLALTLALPFTGPLTVWLSAQASAAEQGVGTQQNPRAEYWRQAREGDSGYTTATGPYTTSTLIQNGGQNWRQLRNGPIATYASGLLLGVLVLLLGFFLTRGRIRLEQGFSDKVVPRWSVASRVLHWYVAILFILLAITGLSLLFGRAVLIPVFGAQGFAAYAELAITVHNYLGPAFVVGVVLVLVLWMKDNIPRRHDWIWLKKAGGIFTRGSHPPAGRNNAGEKLLTFWTLATFGVIACVSGLVLDFPIFGQSREDMQLANLVHAASTILWTLFMFGHIYLGSIGQEGTLEAMTKGYVDVNWARQHSNLWLDEVQDQIMDRPDDRSGSGIDTRRPARPT